MRDWSPLQVSLLVVAVVVFGAVAVLGFMALEPDQQDCTTGSYEPGVEIDRPAEEALGVFVSNHPEIYPLDGWEVASSDGDATVFTNEVDGQTFEVTVTGGVATSFERCET